MRMTWLPWSAASLACGAVLMVLGSLLLPAGGDFADLVASVESDHGQWVVASFAFYLAAVGMTLGMPSVIVLLSHRGRVLGLTGIGIWAIGTIGLAGYAALLVLLRAVIGSAELTAGDVEAVTNDRTLLAFVAVFAVAFVLGELLTALALLRSRAVARWVSGLLVVHAALQAVTALVADMTPDLVRDLTAMLLGVALMGVAVEANDEWSASAA